MTPDPALPPRRRIVQLVSPVEGGVRDYAERLAASWLSNGTPNDIWALDASQAALRPLADRLASSHDRTGTGSALLLHFSGYGFHRRGLCHWLVREIEQGAAGAGR